ncbi:uncharacterized protein LOC131931255 [Physella acuta]|uniref:uncharacterized protein LOC131931255 n=1 Tax=Physella acuta TaxID=109671 RepID=UPI0027DC7964|nr:uncharacterized protein LOC131931255 [Physella acuta]
MSIFTAMKDLSTVSSPFPPNDNINAPTAPVAGDQSIDPSLSSPYRSHECKCRDLSYTDYEQYFVEEALVQKLRSEINILIKENRQFKVRIQEMHRGLDHNDSSVYTMSLGPDFDETNFSIDEQDSEGICGARSNLEFNEENFVQYELELTDESAQAKFNGKKVDNSFSKRRRFSRAFKGDDSEPERNQLDEPHDELKKDRDELIEEKEQESKNDEAALCNNEQDKIVTAVLTEVKVRRGILECLNNLKKENNYCMHQIGVRRVRRGGGRYNDNADIGPNAEQFRKLFVRGLNYKTEENGLRKHFETWGEIVHCKVIRDHNTKKSKGFGFVTYKDSAMIDIVQLNRPHTIDNWEVQTMRAMPRDFADTEHLSVEQLFIGKMKEDTTEEQIREVFGHFGNIKSVNFIREKRTGKVRPFAFVSFEDYDSVDKAVLIKTHALNGHTVGVRKAFSKEEMTGGGTMKGGRYSARGWSPYGGSMSRRSPLKMTLMNACVFTPSLENDTNERLCIYPQP